MKVLFIGDIVGSPGRDMVFDYLPRLKRKYSPDVVIANGKMQHRAEELRKQFLMTCSGQGWTLSRWGIIRGIKKRFMILSMIQITSSAPRISQTRRQEKE